VVAVDEPHLGHSEDGGQFKLQRSLRLQIAQEHNGSRSILIDRFKHMLEVAVRVAKEIDHESKIRLVPANHRPWSGRSIWNFSKEMPGSHLMTHPWHLGQLPTIVLPFGMVSDRGTCLSTPPQDQGERSNDRASIKYFSSIKNP